MTIRADFFPLNPVADAEQVIYDVWVHQPKPHLHTQKPCAYFKVWFLPHFGFKDEIWDSLRGHHIFPQTNQSSSIAVIGVMLWSHMSSSKALVTIFSHQAAKPFQRCLGKRDELKAQAPAMRNEQKGCRGRGDCRSSPGTREGILCSSSPLPQHTVHCSHMSAATALRGCWA